MVPPERRGDLFMTDDRRKVSATWSGPVPPPGKSRSYAWVGHLWFALLLGLVVGLFVGAIAGALAAGAGGTP